MFCWCNLVSFFFLEKILFTCKRRLFWLIMTHLVMISSGYDSSGFCRVSNNFSCVRKFSRKLTIFYRGKKLKYSKIEFFHFFGEKNHSWPWTSKSFWRTNLLASIAPIGYCFRALPFQAISVTICPEPFVNRLVNCGLIFFAWFRVLNFRLENLYDKKELAVYHPC